ncbi:MAG: TRADD-N-associated membrane domain-containing protein [Candidatus Heimdallarchaeota archaeon]
MGLELSDKDRGFINVMIIGIVLIVVGLATIFTNHLEVYIPLIVGGLIVIVVGILNFQRTRRKKNELKKALFERLDRESEDDDELSARANEWFSKKTQEI